jgi:hypothetical protein
MYLGKAVQRKYVPTMSIVNKTAIKVPKARGQTKTTIFVDLGHCSAKKLHFSLKSVIIIILAKTSSVLSQNCQKFCIFYVIIFSESYIALITACRNFPTFWGLRFSQCARFFLLIRVIASQAAGLLKAAALLRAQPGLPSSVARWYIF